MKMNKKQQEQFETMATKFARDLRISSHLKVAKDILTTIHF